jgi:hypothetical protein
MVLTSTSNSKKEIMKKRFIRNIAILLLILGSATNCVDHLKELNVDPTAADADAFNPNFLLSSAQLRYTGSADFSYETWRAQLIHFSVMMQHFSTTLTYWVGDKYTVNTSYQYSYFQRAYDEQVKFIVDAYEISKDKPEYNNLHQIIRIWKVVVFHRITDIYGDIPYFDAGQGYYKRIFNPEYDTQESIYLDMLKELDEAAAALTDGGDVATGDMIYGGNVAKWKKFAYSMMLRLGMRLTKVNNTLAKQWAEKAAAAGVMTAITDNAFILHDPTGGRPTVNRISQVFESNGGERAQVKWSKTFIDFLKSNNDPRLTVLAEIPPAGAGTRDYTYQVSGDNTFALQVGMPNGYNVSAPVPIASEPNYPGAYGSDALGNYSRPRQYLLRLNSPTFVQTYAEVELLLAEAKERGYTISGTAAEHYNAGVRAAMTQLSQYDAAATISSGAVDAYLIAHPYVPGAGAINQIATQYWAATILNDYETFANWRRTGFPVLTPTTHPTSVTGGVIPRRLSYPASEAADNSTNYEDAVGRLANGDTFLSRVWWDQ